MTHALRDQPLRRAPRTLERRVLAQIEAGAVAAVGAADSRVGR